MPFNGQAFGEQIVRAVREFVGKELDERDAKIRALEKRLAAVEREARNARKGFEK